ncbi:MAG: U32 family peptidase, partial [Alphaproteobacteria bacterium]|nr:U32 family peptidase [Alphaproteobacteria bacterium]
ENAPEINRFVSTQANICSAQTVKFWQSMGAKLCVLGREVTFAEMEEIRKQCPDIALECFMHGAMCMSYSGRCLISNFLADRSANKGKCAHCCRWHYKLHLKMKDGTVRELIINDENKNNFEYLLEEDFRPGEYYEVVEDEHGSYILNSKDMCLMPRLNDLLRIGMDSLKVEGRNKTEYYAGVVARAYRKAIDDYYHNPEDWNGERYMPELMTLQNRGYCLGFHDGKLTNIAQNYEYTRTLGEWLFAGSIVEWQGDDAIFEIRNCIAAGEPIEFLIPNGLDNFKLVLTEFEDAKTGQLTAKVSAGQGKQIRIKPHMWGKDIAEIKKLLPQYVIARRFQGLSGENQEMYKHKISEWNKIKG